MFPRQCSSHITPIQQVVSVSIVYFPCSGHTIQFFDQRRLELIARELTLGISYSVVSLLKGGGASIYMGDYSSFISSSSCHHLEKASLCSPFILNIFSPFILNIFCTRVSSFCHLPGYLFSPNSLLSFSLLLSSPIFTLVWQLHASSSQPIPQYKLVFVPFKKDLA